MPRKILILLLFLTTFTNCIFTQSLTPEQLAEEFNLIRSSLELLHPGLYRYNSEEQVNQSFTALEKDLQSCASSIEVFEKVSTFLATIQCGHTYANFVNQEKALESLLIESTDKVPFTFRIINQKMIIHQNVSGNPILNIGDEIISINGMSVDVLLDRLKRFVKADGGNDYKRYFDLQVFGVDHFEAFDVYLPFVVSLGNTIDLRLIDYDTKETEEATVELLSRKERYQRLGKKYGNEIVTYDDYWNFEILQDSIAYLKLGTFVTWRMSINWKNYLKEVFDEIRQKKLQYLVIDIRGNEGGLADVQAYLYKHLTTKNAQIGPFQKTLNYQVVSEDLIPHLDFWKKGFIDLSAKTVRLDDRFYTFKSKGLIDDTRNPKGYAYQGETFLIADASNSSGTYFLINYLKNNQLATVFGQTSGGNKNGITAGQITKLTLPHSKVTIDIPLIGYYPLEEYPNEGVSPDIFIEPKVEDLVNGVDTELEAVLKYIEQSLPMNEK